MSGDLKQRRYCLERRLINACKSGEPISEIADKLHKVASRIKSLQEIGETKREIRKSKIKKDKIIKEKLRFAAFGFRAYDVDCPVCGEVAGTRCTHWSARFDLANELTPKHSYLVLRKARKKYRERYPVKPYKKPIAFSVACPKCKAMKNKKCTPSKVHYSDGSGFYFSRCFHEERIKVAERKSVITT